MVGNHSPDVILRKTASGWSIDLNRSTLPTLEIKEDFAKSVGDRARGSQKDTTKEYVQQSMGSAKWLKRTLEQRNTTTLKIAAELVRRQQSFFRNGLEGLQPMALRDVAEAIGMHESTISRVTSGLLIATPKGTLPMKSFFSVSIAATDDGEAKAAAAVRGMVKEIISKEDPGRPMSDELIARLISKKGIRLARRTVAKYREILRIPSSSERRRRGKLALSS
jgi:RNA polymerase sigma-54 factor